MEQDRQLRDRFDSIDEAVLERLVEENAQESTGLEFKTWGKDDHNKANLAKVISGFANGEGGICIWGVRESSSGAPRTAESLAPIEDAARAIDRLNDWTADATSPRHPSVYHELVGGKFIKTLVPATDGEPVMARFGIDQYRVRVAARNMAMEHFQIADMFGKRAKPKLVFEFLEVQHGEHGRRYIDINLGLRNRGRAVARDLSVALLPQAPWVIDRQFSTELDSYYFVDEMGKNYAHWSPRDEVRSRCHVGQLVRLPMIHAEFLPSIHELPCLHVDAILMADRVMPCREVFSLAAATILRTLPASWFPKTDRSEGS